MSKDKQIVPASDRLKNQGNFTRVPNEIIEHNGISPQAKMVWIELWKFCYHEDDGAFPGMKRIGEELNYHKNTVRKYRKELEDANLLDVKCRGQGKTNLYYLYTPDPQEGVDQDQQGNVGQEPQEGVRKEDEGKEDKVKEDKNITYMTPRKDSEFMNIYLQIFERYTGKEHMAIEQSIYNKVSAKMGKYYGDYGRQGYIDNLVEYFDNFNYGSRGLPKLPHLNAVWRRYFTI